MKSGVRSKVLESSQQGRQVPLDGGGVAARAVLGIDGSAHQRWTVEAEQSTEDEQTVGQGSGLAVAVDVEDGGGLEALRQDRRLGASCP